MFQGQGFMKPSQLRQLNLPKGPVRRRPPALWVGTAALFLAAAINLFTYLNGVFLLLSDFNGSDAAVLLVALSLSAVFLVVLPAWSGIAALKRSAIARWWAILYFVAQFLVAFQSLNPVQYLISALALLAVILLWIPTVRAYSRH